MEDAPEALIDWAKFARMRTQLGADFIRILGYFREDGEKSVEKIVDAMHRRDATALIIPAHTLKTEARQFGAMPLGELAEAIEEAGRRAVEAHLFPDNLIPEVARLRPLYEQTIALLDQRANPLVARRSMQDRPTASNQQFGRL